MKRVVLKNGWKLYGPVYHDNDELQQEHPARYYQIAKMPAMVHSVLMDNGVIGDPWKADAAEKMRWVSWGEWRYELDFEAEDVSSEVRLCMDGLDAIAEIKLNDETVGFWKNEYAPCILDISGKLRAENHLSITFYPAITLDGARNPEYAPFRKCEQDYINYLGPYPWYCKVGVFRPVIMEYTGLGEISSCSAQCTVDEHLENGNISVSVQGKVIGEETVLTGLLKDASGKVVCEKVLAEHVTGDYDLKADVAVEHPQLWYPTGYGEPTRYEFSVILTQQGQVLDTKLFKLGFRHLEMEKPLHFKVNHIPVRLWGGCYVTPDFVTLVWNEQRTRKTLERLKQANMNAIRVWAICEPQPNEFYDICDEMGIMVWQDFHQLRAGDEPETVKQAMYEVEYTVRKLQHHPCIFIWSGGNEGRMWYDFHRKTHPFGGTKTHEERMPELCRKLDDRPTIPESPYYGFDANDPRVWDTHGYTNAWYVPYYDYLNFASEDTRISAPEVRSLKRFFCEGDLWPEGYSSVRHYGNQDPWPANWNRYTTSASNRKTGDVEHFYDADSPETLVYQLGAAAGEYYRDTIERQRRGRPSGSSSNERCCGGYLVWKFNDSWPQLYSGKLDYFLEPYPVYWYLKRAFEPVQLSFDLDRTVVLWGVNDTVQLVEGTVTAQLFDPQSNEVLSGFEKEVVILPGESLEIAELTDLFRTISRDWILFAQLRDKDGNVICRTSRLMDYEKRLIFEEPQLTVEYDSGILTVKTDRFAHAVVLSGDEDGDSFGWEFGDNYFDLMPGEVKQISVGGRHTKGEITLCPIYSDKKVTVKIN